MISYSVFVNKLRINTQNNNHIFTEHLILRTLPNFIFDLNINVE